ncbi:MAG: TolC family protein [Neomegalonema sp.]|nr:TolC family protein [Neomegalonema sp.]
MFMRQQLRKIARVTTRSGRLAVLGGALLLSACTVEPEPIETHELRKMMTAQLTEVLDQQEPVARPIDLSEAIARAIRYNLDHRVRVLEHILASEEISISGYDMLPTLAAKAGLSERSNQPGTSNVAQSQEEQVRTADLEASWSVLDFGLSYVRAHQSADRALIASEQRRKIVGRIIEDVRSAYWRAVSAQRLLVQLATLEGDIEKALRKSRDQYAQRRTSPLAAVTYQRELMLIREKILSLQTDLSVSKAQLATLMNMPPSARFALVVPDRNAQIPQLEEDRLALIATALESRPELREAAYEIRIESQEDIASILQLLPNASLFAGVSYDANAFLINNQWADYGARVSWNLLKLVRLPDTLKRNEYRRELMIQRAAATTLAVISQVDVAVIRFEHLARELRAAEEKAQVQDRILEQITAAFRAGQVSEQTLLRERMNQLVSQVQFDVAYADVQNAYANILAAVGSDPYSAALSDGGTIAQMAQAFRDVGGEMQEIALSSLPRSNAEALASDELDQLATLAGLAESDASVQQAQAPVPPEQDSFMTGDIALPERREEPVRSDALVIAQPAALETGQIQPAASRSTSLPKPSFRYVVSTFLGDLVITPARVMERD